MQDRYAGDIGDYVKLAILRRLTRKKRLGVLWWRYPDEHHNADGKHIAYLNQPAAWRSYDPKLFDALQALIVSGNRTVAALEAADLFRDVAFFNDVVPTAGTSSDRRSGRAAWFQEALERVADCDLVFLDPDNGLETKGYKPGSGKAGKSVALAELAALKAPGRTIIVYHHQTRMAGGHIMELAHWGARIASLGFSVDALRASAFSARAFFLLDASDEVRAEAKAMAHAWGERLTWHPNLG